jgi:hypothetical protein
MEEAFRAWRHAYRNLRLLSASCDLICIAADTLESDSGQHMSARLLLPPDPHRREMVQYRSQQPTEEPRMDD